MKNFSLLLFIAVLLPSIVFAKKDYSMNIQHVRDVPGMTKAQIFNKAKLWFAEYFVSLKAVIQYADEKSGTIIGNVLTPLPCKGLFCVSGSRIKFRIKLETKPGKFRITFENVMYVFPPRGHFSNQVIPLRQKKSRRNAKATLIKSTNSLQNYITKKDEKW